MKALTDSLHAMKLFHEIIVYIINMTFDYLLVRSNKYAKIHFFYQRDWVMFSIRVVMSLLLLMLNHAEPSMITISTKKPK